MECARRVTLTSLTVLLSNGLGSQSVTKEAGPAFLASEAGGVINAAETLASDAVTVANSVRVNVAGAVTLATLSPLSMHTWEY